jgi:predicted permease
VKAVSFSENGLFSGTESADGLAIPGYDSPKDADKVAASDEIGPNYFSVVGIPVLLGRGIGPQDTATSPSVAVVNQAFAKFYFPNQNPIGRKFSIEDPERPQPPFEIVGVVGDAKERSLAKLATRRFYLAFFQQKLRKQTINVEVRTLAEPATVSDSVRKVIQSIDASLPIDSTKSLDVLINSSITEQIALAKLSGFFAALALGLACIGLYGVMSYTVAGRTREIGVRMALGAKRADVLRLVLGEAMLLVGVGIVVGIPAALGGSRLLSSMLFGLNASDPASLLMVTVVLGAVAALASYIPARRATKVDPMIALRYE